MITPEELEKKRLERVQDFVANSIKIYEKTMQTENPEDGFWSVSVSSLPWFTPEEREDIRTRIEEELRVAGWYFEPTCLIYGYKLRPRN